MDKFRWFYLGLLVGGAMTLVAAFHDMAPKTHAIERGYALYCPTTGAFAWKGECDD